MRNPRRQLPPLPPLHHCLNHWMVGSLLGVVCAGALLMMQNLDWTTPIGWPADPLARLEFLLAFAFSFGLGSVVTGAMFAVYENLGGSNRSSGLRGGTWDLRKRPSADVLNPWRRPATCKPVSDDRPPQRDGGSRGRGIGIMVLIIAVVIIGWGLGYGNGGYGGSGRGNVLTHQVVSNQTIATLAESSNPGGATTNPR